MSYKKDLQYVKNIVQRGKWTKHLAGRLNDPLFKRLYSAYLSHYQAIKELEEIELMYELKSYLKSSV